MLFSAIQLTAVSTEQHSLTTALKAFSMVQDLERIFLPMPCRSTSPCLTRTSSQYHLPFQKKMVQSQNKSVTILACSMNTAAVLDLCLEEVLQMKHRKLHLTENYAERKRSAKARNFNHCQGWLSYTMEKAILQIKNNLYNFKIEKQWHKKTI